jgi:hypothetical protein
MEEHDSMLIAAQEMYANSNYESSKIISGFLLSLNISSIYTDAANLHADSLAALGEFNRSLKYYEIGKGSGYINASIMAKDYYRARDLLEAIPLNQRSIYILTQLSTVYSALNDIK